MTVAGVGAGRRARWPVVVVAAVMVATWARLLSWPFFGDDWVYMHVAQAAGWWHGARVWNAGGVLFRPVLYLYLGALYRLFGLHPLPAHALTLAAVLAETAAVYRLGRTLGLGKGALTPAAFVGLHPTMAIPLAWVSAVSSPVAVGLAVTAVNLSLGPQRATRRIAAVACFAAGLLTREVVVGAPLVVLLLHLATGPRTARRSRPWREAVERSLPLAAVVVVYAVVRIAAGYPRRGPDLYRMRVGWSAAGYAWHLLEWAGFVELPGHPALTAAWAAGFWTALVAGAVWAATRGTWLPMSGLAWCALGLLPVTFLTSQTPAYYYVDFALPGTGLALASLFAAAVKVWRAPAGAVGWQPVAIVGVAALASVSWVISPGLLRSELAGTRPAMQLIHRVDPPILPGNRLCDPYEPGDAFFTGAGDYFRVVRRDPGLVLSCPGRQAGR